MMAILTLLSLHSAAADQTTTAYIIDKINDYRASLDLSPVQACKETCDFAKIRAKELATDFSHHGFDQRVKTGTLPYSHWTVITENIAKTNNYKEVVSLWEHSPGHAKNMRADTPCVCVEQYGQYFDYVGMKP